VENLLFSKDKKLKHFRQNLLDFWDLLILECQSNILFDEKLFDKCIGYIIAISW
jgi:cohesin complex subunit SA-1/2